MAIWGSGISLVTSRPDIGPGSDTVEAEGLLSWTPHELSQVLEEPESHSPHHSWWQEDKFV